HEVLTYKGGFMEGTSLDELAFKSIAKLPGREVLNGQLAGVVASPLTGLVRGLGSMIQGLALQLGQIAEKGLVSGEAPAEAAPAEEPAPAAPDDSGDGDAPTAGGDVGGTAPEDASATGGGGGSPAATGPADDAPDPSPEENETSNTDDDDAS